MTIMTNKPTEEKLDPYAEDDYVMLSKATTPPPKLGLDAATQPPPQGQGASASAIAIVQPVAPKAPGPPPFRPPLRKPPAPDLRPTPFEGVKSVGATPALTPAGSGPLSILRGKAGVKGFVHRSESGEVYVDFNGPQAFGDLLALVEPMAKSIGDSLMLGTRVDLHIATKDARYLAARLDDGSRVDTELAPNVNTLDLARSLKG
jgi:hypothetical protein